MQCWEMAQHLVNAKWSTKIASHAQPCSRYFHTQCCPLECLLPLLLPPGFKNPTSSWDLLSQHVLFSGLLHPPTQLTHPNWKFLDAGVNADVAGCVTQACSTSPSVWPKPMAAERIDHCRWVLILEEGTQEGSGEIG